jgi:hypothetical protein
MRTTKDNYSFGERLLVVTIIVLVCMIAVNELIQSVKRSEERAVNAASVEFSAVRKMYAEAPASVAQPAIQASALNAESYPSLSHK